MHTLTSRNPVVRRSVRALFESVDASRLDLWERLLSESCAIDPNRREPFHESVARAYDIPLGTGPREGFRLLFAIQTFFAAVIKKIVSDRLGFELDDPHFSWARPLLPETPTCPTGLSDVFGGVYRNLYPAPARKALGEFYTPDWLATLLLRQLDSGESPILDPTCGSGVFLLAGVRMMLARGIAPQTILERIRGFDLNPLGVLMARANIALALELETDRAIPIFLRDSILEEPRESERERFDLVGNPPWLNWDRFPQDYREKTKPIWERYGFFSLSGSEARYGGAKKELALLMVFRTVDLYLRPGGRSAMILPSTVFQTGKAGEGFRRFRLPDGQGLRVLRVDDFTELAVKPFPEVASRPATLLLEKGAETVFPVPYFRWKDQETQTAFWASPIDSKRPESPWSIRNDKNTVADRKKSDYRAYLGANTAGANGIFWFEPLGPSPLGEHLVRVRNLPACGKQVLETVTTDLEKELLYPLLCWKDVDRDRIRTPSRWILLPQDIKLRRGIEEARLREEYPKTFHYLKHFEQNLRDRAAFRKFQSSSPFYSMYNIGWQTLAPIKVVWRRMDSRLRAAVVETVDHSLLGRKVVVPQETCALIPCESIDEARYLVEILNSDVIEERIRSFSPIGSKGFGSPGMLDYLGIPRYSPNMPAVNGD